MRQQAPLGSPPKGRTDGFSWLGQTTNPSAIGGLPPELKIASISPKRQLSRQVPVGTGDLHHKRFCRREGGLEVEVYQGEIDLCPLIPWSLRRPTRGIPERLGLCVAFGHVPEGVEGCNSRGSGKCGAV